MTRIEELSVAQIRSQLGIEQEDPRVFRRIRLREALRVARMIRDDAKLPRHVRRLAEVGLVLDLMPEGNRPRRHDHALALGVSETTVYRRALQWEGVDPVIRTHCIQRSIRALTAYRGASLR